MQYSPNALASFLAAATAGGKQLDAIVIGSGVGGLTCASLIAQCGHTVLVLEGNESPGGAIQSFHEGAYQVPRKRAM